MWHIPSGWDRNAVYSEDTVISVYLQNALTWLSASFWCLPFTAWKWVRKGNISILRNKYYITGRAQFTRWNRGRYIYLCNESGVTVMKRGPRVQLAEFGNCADCCVWTMTTAGEIWGDAYPCWGLQQDRCFKFRNLTSKPYPFSCCKMVECANSYFHFRMRCWNQGCGSDLKLPFEWESNITAPGDHKCFRVQRGRLC